MKDLVRKELREWGLPCAALLLALCLVWCLGTTAADVLLAPRPEPTVVVLATASLLGFALGYAQLVRERARGTLAYLAHREGGRRALLYGKVAVGAPLVLALGILPPLALLVQESFGPLAGVLQPERAFEYALAGLVALPAYAAGVLTAQIAPTSFLAFAQGVMACAGCCYYSFWLPLTTMRASGWAVLVFVLGELALAALLFALARALFLRSHDREVALPVRLQWGGALVAVLLVVYPAWWAFSGSVQEGQFSLFRTYPLVVRSADGRYATMEHAEFDARIQDERTPHTTCTRPDGVVISEPDPALAYTPWPLAQGARNPLELGSRDGPWSWPLWQEFFQGGASAALPEIHDSTGRPVRPPIRDGNSLLVTRTYFDRDSGLVRQFRDLPISNATPNESRLPRALVIARPDGKSFGRQAFVILAGTSQASLIVDRGDWTIWALDYGPEETRLVPMSLPDGDRFAGLDVDSEWCPEGWLSEGIFQPAFVGAHGRYAWTVAGFRPVDSPEALAAWRRHCRSEVGEASLTAMTVRLRELDGSGRVGPGSAVAFQQRYAPSTPQQLGRAALLRLGMLCGPPVLSAERLLLDSGRPLLRGLLPSPARIPKDFAGVHLLHALLGAAFGVLTWRHLARRGATRVECALWSVIGALFGVFALCFMRVLAPRPSVATDAPAEPKLSATPLAAT